MGPFGMYHGHTPANHGGLHQVHPSTLRAGMRADGGRIGQRCREVDLHEDRDGGTGSRESSRLQKKVYGDRGKELETQSTSRPGSSGMWSTNGRAECWRSPSSLGGILIMIDVSLRFDDGMHVVPEALGMKDEGRYLIVWQTKAERQKKGTRFQRRKGLDVRRRLDGGRLVSGVSGHLHDISLCSRLLPRRISKVTTLSRLSSRGCLS